MLASLGAPELGRWPAFATLRVVPGTLRVVVIVVVVSANEAYSRVVDGKLAHVVTTRLMIEASHVRST